MQYGDPSEAIDVPTSLRLGDYYVKEVHKEAEPSKAICIVTINSLLLRTPSEFERYDKWGEIFKEVYDKLLSLMYMYLEKRRPFEIRMFFHGAEVLRTSFNPKNPQPIKHIGNIITQVFEEINRFMPVLFEEYKFFFEKGNLMPQIQSVQPAVPMSGNTLIIPISNKYLARIKAYANRMSASVGALMGK